MGRTLVRLLNLGYLAAAAVSIWSICTKPVFKATVKIDMTPEKLGEVLEPLFVGEKSSSKVSLTREVSTDKDITDYITAARIAEAFKDDDPKKSGFHVEVPISIDAKYAFSLQDKKVIDKVLINNINTILKKTCETLSDPLAKFVFSITQEFALDALETAINDQIKNAIADGAPVTSDEVKEIYNNVYEMLKDSSEDGEIPLSDLTDVIINGKDGGTSALSILNKYSRYVYYECDPQPTEEQFNANPTEYFVEDEDGKMVNIKTYSGEKTYFTYKYIECSPKPTKDEFEADPTKYFIYDSEHEKYVNIETYNSGATYFVREDRPYTEEDLDRIDIEGQMEQALSEVPGLVETNYYVAEGLTAAEFYASLASTKYYITDGTTYVPASYGEGGKELYVKESETFKPVSTPSDFDSTLVSKTYFVKVGEEYNEAKLPFNSDTSYYTSSVMVKDIDSALVALINQYLLNKDSSESGDGKAILRSRAEGLTNAKSREELTDALTEFAYKYIPMDQVSNVSEDFGQYVPYILLGIIVLVGFPWFLLALITFIRTLRKKKCWTKPWVVIVFAFPQLIFGLILTYGTQYALALAGKYVDVVQQILDSGITLQVNTLCLIPSFIYLGVIVYTIVYAIFAHGVKVQYKFERRQAAIEKYRARRAN